MTTRLTAFATMVLIAPAVEADEPKATFEGDVKPILRKHCLTCHNGERPRGELDLSGFAAVMFGGVSGKAVVPGKADASPLYTQTAHLEDPKMPPNKPKIPQRELDTIRRWIDGGLVEKAAGTAKSAASTSSPAGGLVAAAAFQRPTPITALAVSPVAPLAAVSGQKQVLVFDLATGKLLGGLPFPEGEVHALRFSRDGTVLLAAGGVGGQSGAVVGFQVDSWKRLFTLTDDTDAVLAADISADKTQIVFGGPGRVVKLVSVPDGKPIHTFRKATDWVLSVGFSPEGLLVAAGDRFGGLYVWEAKSGKEFHTLRGHTKGVTGITWRADSNAVASCSEDGTIRVWDMHTGSELSKWDAHAGGVLDISFHPLGTMASAGRDGRVKVWDATGKPGAELGTAADSVLRVAFAPDAKTVVSGDWSGEVRTWPVNGGPGAKLALPIETKAAATAVVPVPVPTAVSAASPGPARPDKPVGKATTSNDLDRKRAALKAVEDAAEKLKEEAARNPKNEALAKAYLQLCEAALALKAEVIETEATLANREGNK